MSFQLDNLTELANNKENFSDFPVILFKNEHFIVQALHWYNASTSIHEHGFNGAFKVLKGSSIETQYKFHDGIDIDAHLQQGRLEKIKTSHLTEGDITEIKGGNAFIHSLIHLESPSITLIARTLTHDVYTPQKSYYELYITTDFFSSIGETKKLLAMLQADAGRLMPIDSTHIGLMFDKLAANQITELLLNYVDITDGPIPKVLTEKYGKPVADKLIESIFSERVKKQLVCWRQSLSDYNSRIVLASMINASNRLEVNHLLSKIAPEGDQIALLTQTIVTLVEHRMISFTLSGDALKDIVEFAVNSCSKDEFFNRLYSEFDKESVDGKKESMSNFWYKLTSEVTLKKLWA